MPGLSNGIVGRWRTEVGIEHKDHQCDGQGQEGNGFVLAPQKRLGAFANGIGNGAHLWGAVVVFEHPLGQTQGNAQGQETTKQGERQFHIHDLSCVFRVVCGVRRETRSLKAGLNIYNHIHRPGLSDLACVVPLQTRTAVMSASRRFCVILRAHAMGIWSKPLRSLSQWF